MSWYVDYRLVFGSSSSAGIYNAVMEGVEWIVQDRIDQELGVGEAYCRHYLDDFWLGGRTKRSCEAATAIMLDTFEELGIPSCFVNIRGKQAITAWICQIRTSLIALRPPPALPSELPFCCALGRCLAASFMPTAAI